MTKSLHTTPCRPLVYSVSFYGLFIALKLRNDGTEPVLVSPDDRFISASREFNFECYKIQKPSLLKLFIKKTRFLDEIVDIKFSEFHFSHSQHDYICFKLVNLFLKKKYMVFFHDIEYKYEQIISFRPTSLKELIFFCEFLCTKLLLNLPISVSKYGGAYVPQLKLEEFRKYPNFNRYLYSQSYEDEKLQLVLKYQLNTIEFDSLFIDQGYQHQHSIIDVEQYQSVLKLIMSNNVHLKPHPLHSEKNDFCSYQVVKLPAPVEFYFQSVKRNIIGINSAAMIAATKIKHLKVVSIVRLLQWKKKEYEILALRYFGDCIDSVIFPKNIRELEELLNK